MKASSGFSLTELMIVLALVMLMVGLTSFSTRFFNTSLLVSELNLLHTTCYYLQQAAMATGEVQTLVFDSDYHGYRAHDYVHQLPGNVCFGIIEAKGPPSTPHTLLKEPITFSDNRITFSPDGIISSGTAYLTDSHHLYALSSAVGHVSFLRKYRYDGKWHLI